MIDLRNADPAKVAELGEKFARDWMASNERPIFEPRGWTYGTNPDVVTTLRSRACPDLDRVWGTSRERETCFSCRNSCLIRVKVKTTVRPDKPQQPSAQDEDSVGLRERAAKGQRIGYIIVTLRQDGSLEGSPQLKELLP